MTDSAKPLTASEREALIADLRLDADQAEANVREMPSILRASDYTERYINRPRAAAAELSRLAAENESQARRIEYLEGLAINTSAEHIWRRKNRELEGAAINDAALCLRESPLGGRCSKPLGHDTHDCGPLSAAEKP